MIKAFFCINIICLLLIVFCGCKERVVSEISHSEWVKNQLLQIDKHNGLRPIYGLGAQRLLVGKIIAIEPQTQSPRLWLEPAYWIKTSDNIITENHRLEIWTHRLSDSTGLAVDDWLVVRSERGLKDNQNFLLEKLVWKSKHP